MDEPDTKGYVRVPVEVLQDDYPYRLDPYTGKILLNASGNPIKKRTPKNEAPPSKREWGGLVRQLYNNLKIQAAQVDEYGVPTMSPQVVTATLKAAKDVEALMDATADAAEAEKLHEQLKRNRARRNKKIKPRDEVLEQDPKEIVASVMTENDQEEPAPLARSFADRIGGD